MQCCKNFCKKKKESEIQLHDIWTLLTVTCDMVYLYNIWNE